MPFNQRHEHQLLALPPEMVAAIADWSARNEVDSEAEATRRLLTIALNSEEQRRQDERPRRRKAG